MRLKAVIVLLMIVGVFACTPRPVMIAYRSVPHFPPTDPYRVHLLRSEPHHAHIKLGEVRFTPTPDLSPYYVENALKEKAAMMGADALVIVVDNFYRRAVVHGYYYPHLRVYSERVIIGVAIRYQ